MPAPFFKTGTGDERIEAQGRAIHKPPLTPVVDTFFRAKKFYVCVLFLRKMCYIERKNVLLL